MAFTVAIVTLLFVIAWLPLFSLTMVATFNPEVLPSPTTSARVLHFVKWMHYSSSAFNPFLYSYRNQDLRRTIMVLLQRLFLRRGPGVVEVFRSRRSSSAFASTFRKLSMSSDRSRKISTESQQSTFRARSGTVLPWIGSRRNSGKEKKCTKTENNNIVWKQKPVDVKSVLSNGQHGQLSAIVISPNLITTVSDWRKTLGGQKRNWTSNLLHVCTCGTSVSFFSLLVKHTFLYVKMPILNRETVVTHFSCCWCHGYPSPPSFSQV